LAAISASHLSPLLNNFSLLYNSSSCVSVENSKLGPSTIASTGQASYISSNRNMTKHIRKTNITENDLTKSTVDAFCHVNIVTCRSPSTVSSLLSFNGDGLCRTNSLAKLTSNAPLLARRVPPVCR